MKHEYMVMMIHDIELKEEGRAEGCQEGIGQNPGRKNQNLHEYAEAYHPAGKGSFRDPGCGPVKVPGKAVRRYISSKAVVYLLTFDPFEIGRQLAVHCRPGQDGSGMMLFPWK